jgi:hypothetical protein
MRMIIMMTMDDDSSADDDSSPVLLFGMELWLMVLILAGGGGLLLILITLGCVCRSRRQHKKVLNTKTHIIYIMIKQYYNKTQATHNVPTINSITYESQPLIYPDVISSLLSPCRGGGDETGPLTHPTPTKGPKLTLSP